MGLNNTTRATAWELTIGPSGKYVSGPVDNTGYTRSTDGDHAGDPDVYRHAWWRYRPTGDGFISFSGAGSTIPSGEFVEIKMFHLVSGSLVFMQDVYNSTVNGPINVFEGETYFFCQGVSADVHTTYGLVITAGAANTDPPVNDTRSAATFVYLPDDSSVYEAAPVHTDQLTYVDDPDDDPYGTGFYRSAWWTVISAGAGTLTVSPSKVQAGATSASAFLDVFDGALSRVGDVAATGSTTQDIEFTGIGQVFYLRMYLTSDNSGQVYRLTFTGAATASSANAFASSPPISVHTSLPGVSTVENFQAPPVSVHITTHTPGAADYPVPPVTVYLRLLGPQFIDATLFLSSPAPDELVVTNFPQFMVGLISGLDESTAFTIEVQYDSTNAFNDDPQTLSADILVVDGGAILDATGPAPATTWWRARLLQGGDEVVAWTTPQSFTVDASIDAAELAITWTVDEDAARPIHLWHFDPPGAAAGDTVTAYGQGFPLTTGNLLMNGEGITAQSWELIDASDNAATDERIIDGDLVDPEHFEVVFLAPDVDEPGGPIVVEA